MEIGDWVAMVDELRVGGGSLERGYWHGYLNEDSPVIHGRYVLVRWERPSVLVAHDDRDEVLRLADVLERALAGPLDEGSPEAIPAAGLEEG